MTRVVVRREAAAINSMELTSRLRRDCASLAPLVGQNDDPLTIYREKLTQILQIQSRQYRQRCCHHFPQVGGAAHLAPVMREMYRGAWHE